MHPFFTFLRFWAQTLCITYVSRSKLQIFPQDFQICSKGLGRATIRVRYVDMENLNDGLGLRVTAYSRNSWWNFLNTYNFTFTHAGLAGCWLGLVAIWAPHQELLMLWMIIFLFWSLWFTAPKCSCAFRLRYYCLSSKINVSLFQVQKCELKLERRFILSGKWTVKNDPMAQTDSGHDSLHSENETSPPIQQQDPVYAPVQKRWVIKQNYFVM